MHCFQPCWRQRGAARSLRGIPRFYLRSQEQVFTPFLVERVPEILFLCETRARKKAEKRERERERASERRTLTQSHLICQDCAMRLRSGEHRESSRQFVVVLGVGKVRGHSSNKPNCSKLVRFLRGRIRTESVQCTCSARRVGAPTRRATPGLAAPLPPPLTQSEVISIFEDSACVITIPRRHTAACLQPARAGILLV